MYTDELISVIIPAHNAQATLAEAISSVLAQTYTNLEVIVVNNASSDLTNVVARLWAKKDSRVKCIDTTVKGAVNARNLGSKHSRGEYIAYLDADDVWLSNKLELQLESLHSNPEAVLCYCGAEFIDEYGRFLYNYLPNRLDRGNVLSRLLQRNFIVCGSLPLVKRQAIERVGDWDDIFLASHDWDYWIRIAMIGQFEVVNVPLVKYRIVEGSISSNIQRRLDCNFKVLEKAYERVGDEYQKYKPISLGNVWVHGAKMHIQRDNDKNLVRHYLLRAIKTNPKLVLDGEYLKLVAKSFIK